MNNKKQNIGPPDRLHTIFEGVVAHRDAVTSLVAAPVKNLVLPQGDGHPVLVLPGFMAHDVNMVPLRMFLDSMNYKSETWDGGINWGPSAELRDHLKKRLKEVFDKHGGRKVSLIGWSLGGIYARELAREFPDMVRQVISLGSPFHAVEHPDSTVVGPLFARINPDVKPEIEFDPRLPIEPPMTSIYTRKDGVVNWRTCILAEGQKTENVEVGSSHLGLIVSPQAMIVIADRLAQPEGHWSKFAPSKYPFAFIRSPKQQAHNSLWKKGP